MSQQVNWREYHEKQHLLEWLITEAMAKKGMKHFLNVDPTNITVDFKINGVEVDFVGQIERLQGEINRMIQEAREEGRKDAKSEIVSSLQDWLEDRDNFGAA